MLSVFNTGDVAHMQRVKALLIVVGMTERLVLVKSRVHKGYEPCRGGFSNFGDGCSGLLVFLCRFWMRLVIAALFFIGRFPSLCIRSVFVEEQHPSSHSSWVLPEIGSCS